MTTAFRLCTFLVFSSTLFTSLASSVESDRPNVVLIMCDDMGWSDIGCYGGEVETPNLNRLAAEGMRFTQFYNNAKCTTTRASILTGLYPRRDKGGLLRSNMVTIGEVMKLAGYQTSLSGKWHLGSDKETHPYHRGFDEFYGLLDGCCNFFDPSFPDPAHKGGKIREFGQNDKKVTSFPNDFYTTDAFTDHAIGCIQKFSKNDSPFLIHVTYTAPHYPLHAKPQDIAKYRGKYKEMGGWLKLREQRWQRMQAMGLTTESWRLSEVDEKAYDWETADHDHEDLRMATYAAMIDSMDQNIGRLRTALEQAGVADNTLILFLSDNGGCTEEPGGRSADIIPGPKEFYASVGPAWGWAQNTPFKKHKSHTCEGGILTPCIAWWPGQIKAGEITAQPAHIIDIMPTLLNLAGSKYPATHNGHELLPLDGKSMLPILEGKKREPHQQLAWEWAGNRSLREGDWKVVWQKEVGEWELYNLAKDRCETTDLASAEPKLTKRLSADWTTWAKKTGVSFETMQKPKKRKEKVN
jgi:arylsulfatase A-like enzyme